MTSPSSERAPELTVGGYRLLTRIGEGGMGVVHLAMDAEGRRAALKVLRPNVVSDDESRRRLAREVDSLRQVHSRHVAEILDADPWAEVPFVVTRYVPGHSLHETVRRDGPLPLADLEYAGRGLLQAVRDVHAADVLHRDLKPTNVVMEGRAPILIDFGLARLAEDPRLTATGMLMGTPGYLAPEVLFGEPATTATDVHGWAATMVYAATGEPPYGRGHMMTVLDRTRRGEVDLRPVPEVLRPLLADCLAPDPLDRPTVGEALAAVESLGEPPPTMPWQAAHHAEPSTRVVPGPPAPVTRPYTVVAPLPRPVVQPSPARPPIQHQIQPSVQPPMQVQPRALAPAPGQVVPQEWARPLLPHRLTGWARFRMWSTLVGLGAVTTLGFGAAPYLTFLVLSLAVLMVRGISHTQQATWRRRSLRGPKWFDGTLALAGYPWHVLRGSAGAVVLLGLAGALAACTVAPLVVLGVAGPDALLAGGAVLAIGTWWGPGAGRVRQPVVRMTSALARNAVAGWLTVAVVATLAWLLWLALVRDGITWTPAAGPPWRELRGLRAWI